MGIAPELLPFLDQFPALELARESLARTRAELNKLSKQAADELEGFDHIDVSDEFIDRPRGGGKLRLRLHARSKDSGKRPGLLWIHGGGYILGSPEMDEPQLCRMADELGCLVVAADYRLAPEHPWPAALDDCDAALGWMIGNSGALRIDTGSLALAGASAGGGLAAALALRARDQRPGAIRYQCLIYPMLDHRNVTPAASQAKEYFLWDHKKNRFAWDCYLGPNDPSGDMSPFASPARADQLEGLPPAYLCIGEEDLFYQESLEYARRLRDSGVAVELEIVPGAPHAFDKLPAPMSERSLKRRFAALAQHFAQRA
ncbi:MAG: alpha/beta hydrolase [Gammaproteobacteria bacterium]|nr:alpha/beta hydrolase [Gammaproteobacteria bacterium]